MVVDRSQRRKNDRGASAVSQPRRHVFRLHEFCNCMVSFGHMSGTVLERLEKSGLSLDTLVKAYEASARSHGFDVLLAALLGTASTVWFLVRPSVFYEGYQEEKGGNKQKSMQEQSMQQIQHFAQPSQQTSHASSNAFLVEFLFQAPHLYLWLGYWAQCIETSTASLPAASLWASFWESLLVLSTHLLAKRVPSVLIKSYQMILCLQQSKSFHRISSAVLPSA